MALASLDSVTAAMPAPRDATARAGAGSAELPGLADNLRQLCRQRRSTSEVCRAIGINRQQFNKYLSGAAVPSSFNLARIATCSSPAWWSGCSIGPTAPAS